jgi:hypothetical protein
MLPSREWCPRNGVASWMRRRWQDRHPEGGSDLLNWVYNAWTSSIGHCRYGLMLDETEW